MLSMGFQTLIILGVFLVVKLLKNKNNFFKTLNKFLKFNFNFKQILYAITIIVVVDVLLIIIQLIILNRGIAPAVFEWDTPIQPIAEELMARGVYTYLFYQFLTIKNPKLKPSKISLKSKIIYIPINALLFMLIHWPVEPINHFRFIDGLIYCGLYLYYDYNLVPPIIAHIASNLLMIWWF